MTDLTVSLERAGWMIHALNEHGQHLLVGAGTRVPDTARSQAVTDARLALLDADVADYARSLMRIADSLAHARRDLAGAEAAIVEKFTRLRLRCAAEQDAR